ncbi:hypothetical protein FN846DRAFT_903404 [Sphaerosporella brunnea]|uniref:Uncharacterized protein n=1 Tax=Sphaerosporella brunnea TaxID=1250544 RepID=A0A5J5F7E2_9PEZI|nr:hypothetical protein FN846DRAFT_903404 [Sphaerosporella brunnea]
MGENDDGSNNDDDDGREEGTLHPGTTRPCLQAKHLRSTGWSWNGQPTSGWILDHHRSTEQESQHHTRLHQRVQACRIRAPARPQQGSRHHSAPCHRLWLQHGPGNNNALSRAAAPGFGRIIKVTRTQGGTFTPTAAPHASAAPLFIAGEPMLAAMRSVSPGITVINPNEE